MSKIMFDINSDQEDNLKSEYGTKSQIFKPLINVQY